MNGLDASAFIALFKEACQKCFGHPLNNVLSESESKFFAERIFDQTGLVIGPKSIRNYSVFVISNSNEKSENPSVATLDTLARYVLNASYTDEPQRKNKESHYPYWFQYKEQHHRSLNKPRFKTPGLMITIGAVAVIVALLFALLRRDGQAKEFIEDFRSLADDSLSNHGWFLQSQDEEYWSMRNQKPGHLSLFTLKGDNWPDSMKIPGIRNLLLRKNNSDCFTIEVRLSDFIPRQNWQQAGILLLEDTTFSGRSMRVSFAYNNFFGGYTQSPEIIIQAITSQGKGNKPEEFFHKSLFTMDSQPDSLIVNNLRKSGLRIEKQGNKFRLLYTTSPVENFAFKEAVTKEFIMKPKYIGLFALKGQVDSSQVIPASFEFFGFQPTSCK